MPLWIFGAFHLSATQSSPRAGPSHSRDPPRARGRAEPSPHLRECRHSATTSPPTGPRRGRSRTAEMLVPSLPASSSRRSSRLPASACPSALHCRRRPAGPPPARTGPPARGNAGAPASGGVPVPRRHSRATTPTPGVGARSGRPAHASPPGALYRPSPAPAPRGRGGGGPGDGGATARPPTPAIDSPAGARTGVNRPAGAEGASRPGGVAAARL